MVKIKKELNNLQSRNQGKATKYSFTIPTHNQFSSLQIETDEAMPDDRQMRKRKNKDSPSDLNKRVNLDTNDTPPLPTQTSQTHAPASANKQPKPPPIILHNVINHSAISEFIEKNLSACTQKPNLKILQGNKVKNSFHSKEDHLNWTEMFKKHEIQFNTYPTKEYRSLKLILKGLTAAHTPTHITELLATYEIPVTRIIQFTDDQKKYIGKHKVIFPPGANLQKIKQIKAMWSWEITWAPEIRKSKPDIIQCHNCYKFNHIAKCCGLKAACKRCSGEHPSHSCTSQLIKCTNCAGQHEANSTNCPKRIEAIQIRNNQRDSNKKKLPNQTRQNQTKIPSTQPSHTHTRPVWKPETPPASHTAAANSNQILRNKINTIVETLLSLLNG